MRVFLLAVLSCLLVSATVGALAVRAQCNLSQGCCDETCYVGGSCIINGTHNQGVCQVEVCSYLVFPGGCKNPPDQETSMTCVPYYMLGCGLDFCPEAGYCQ